MRMVRWMYGIKLKDRVPSKELKERLGLLLLLLHPFNGSLSRTTQVSWYQKDKTNLNLLEQEIVSGSGISWAICKSAPRIRQITTPAPHHSDFYRMDALPSCHPTNSIKALKDEKD